MNQRFSAVLAQARKLSDGNAMTEATLVKEVLHLDILAAIARSPLRQQLVFQGGTALRLSYGGLRYSEDLDFVHNEPLTGEGFEVFKRSLRQSMAERYGLELDIKDPKNPVESPSVANGTTVRRWIARVDITAETRDAPHVHKIHIEVADVPAHRPTLRMLTNRYRPSGPPIALQVSSIEEILADKIIAVMYRPYLKARDIWDIKFLCDRNVKLDLALVDQKAIDYQASEAGDRAALAELLNRKASGLASEDAESTVRAELSRFLPSTIAADMLGGPHGAGLLLMEVGQYLEAQAERLGESKSAEQTEDAGAALEAWRQRAQGKTPPRGPGM